MVGDSLRNQFGPYFDQEDPQVPILGMIADSDQSADYELDAAAVFACERGYLVVEVSGCSCWPDRGGTTQTHCPEKADVDKCLSGRWPGLLADCQEVRWEVRKPVTEATP